MPEILHRCVEKVMEKGHSEQSAYAICRTSLGLKDGEDGKGIDMTDEQIDAALAKNLSASPAGFENPLIIYKEPVVAHAGINYVNGDQEFDLTIQDMDEMVKNFTEHPRQVPILFRGDHALGPERADIPAGGWVEGLKRVGNDLVARVKLIGEAASAILKDQFRNVSIGAFQWPDLHGKNIGWRLDHLLITNTGFFADTNIAAQARKGGGPALLYLTAAKEAAMAEKDGKGNTAPAAEDKDVLTLKEDLDATKALLHEKEKAIRELSESNEDLARELKERQKNSDLELALKENRALLRQVTAGKIRELVSLGIDRGQFVREKVKGYEGGDDRSDALTLAWFKNSIFEGDMGKLTFALKTFPKTEMRRTFASGAPAGDGTEGYTPEDQERIRAAGHDPELLAKTRGAENLTDYKRRKAAAQKG